MLILFYQWNSCDKLVTLLYFSKKWKSTMWNWGKRCTIYVRYLLQYSRHLFCVNWNILALFCLMLPTTNRFIRNVKSLIFVAASAPSEHPFLYYHEPNGWHLHIADMKIRYIWITVLERPVSSKSRNANGSKIEKEKYRTLVIFQWQDIGRTYLQKTAN